MKKRKLRLRKVKCLPPSLVDQGLGSDKTGWVGGFRELCRMGPFDYNCHSAIHHSECLGEHSCGKSKHSENDRSERARPETGNAGRSHHEGRTVTTKPLRRNSIILRKCPVASKRC
jgi:hypothetical protein